MKTTNEIKKMSAEELLNTFANNGKKTVETVGVHQNLNTETTTLLFVDCAIEICGSSVYIADYYVASENVSHICERATRDQFVQWFLDCTEWYQEYCSFYTDDEIVPMSAEEYAEDLADTNLTLWDGDEKYQLNI